MDNHILSNGKIDIFVRFQAISRDFNHNGDTDLGGLTYSTYEKICVPKGFAGGQKVPKFF
jgi:hypothetical protein